MSLIALLLLLSLPAATPAPDDGVLTPAALREELQRPIPAYFAGGDDGAEIWEAIRHFYARRDDRPLWRGRQGSGRLEELRRALEIAESHGLPQELYRLQSQAQLRPPSNPVLRSVWEAEQEVRATHALWRLAAHLKRGRLDPNEAGWDAGRRRLPSVEEVEAAIDAGDIGAWLKTLAPSDPAYHRLQAALLRYRQMAGAGEGPRLPAEGPVLKQGSRHRQVETLQRLLVATGDLAPELASPGFGPLLEGAVRQFQRRHGLNDDGVVGPAFRSAARAGVAERISSLEASLERRRWLPRETSRRQLLINVAAAELTAIVDGEAVLTMKTVVGESDHPTRLFSRRLEKVVLWPVWNVPRGLARRKVLPRARSEPDYLRRDGFEVFTLDWRPVNPDAVDWRGVDEMALPFHFRQKAGFRNALGRLTLEFSNRYNIYIHDTPERDLFARDRRLFSAGCVRVDKPVELAALVLGDDWDPAAVGKALAPGRTRQLEVTDDWEVRLVYFTSWVDPAGLVHFRDDPYGLDRQLEQLLAKRFRVR